MIEGREIFFYTDKSGRFWRLLRPGKYQIKVIFINLHFIILTLHLIFQVEAEGYNTKIVDFHLPQHDTSFPKLHVLNIFLANSSTNVVKYETTTQVLENDTVIANTEFLSNESEIINDCLHNENEDIKVMEFVHGRGTTNGKLCNIILICQLAIIFYQTLSKGING